MGVLGSFTKNFTNCQVLLRTAKKIWRPRVHLAVLGHVYTPKRHATESRNGKPLFAYTAHPV
jgi:hypothetical protein